MMKTRSGLWAIVAMIALTACPSSKPTASTPTPTPSASLHSTPWQRVSDEGTVLTLRVYEGGCFTFQRVDVQEQDQEVVITALSALDTSGRICPDDLRSHDEKVTLREPLGARVLQPAPLSDEAERQFGNLPSPRPIPPS